MTTLREAAQQALEALDEADTYHRNQPDQRSRRLAAMAALRAALAQEQAEPIAWLQPKTVDGYSRPDLGYETCSKSDYGAFAVYTAPPQRQPLTEEESDNIYREFMLYQDRLTPSVLQRVVRAVERAHGIVTCGDIKERA